GTMLLDRFGRVAILRLCTALAIAGLALFTLVPWLPVAMAGAVLWGMGAALGFPVGMSAASDDPFRAAARLSVVSTVGYAAFLVGPGTLGLLADAVGTREALLAIMVPLVIGLLVIPAAREPEPRSQSTGADGARSAGEEGAQAVAEEGAQAVAEEGTRVVAAEGEHSAGEDPCRSRRVTSHEDGCREHDHNPRSRAGGRDDVVEFDDPARGRPRGDPRGGRQRRRTDRDHPGGGSPVR